MPHSLSRILTTTTVSAAIAATALSACSDSSGPDALRFMSLAWQTDSVAANEALVDEWNADNPDMPVELIQGSWDSAGDDLLTSFEGGDAPDIIHYEAALAGEFASQGYVADLSDLVPSGLKKEIPENIWQTVTTPDGAITGVPFLLESQAVIANKTLLDEAGIDVPGPDDPWSWDEFADNAKALTAGDTYGTAWPLKQPVNRVLNLGLNFDGQYLKTDADETSVVFGDAEAEVPQRIHDMVYADKSADPDALSMGATDPLPGFFDGQYAMLPGSIYLRQQMVEQAPEDFEWVTLPPLKGVNQNQAANPNTLSIAAESEHPEEAMRFIDHFLQPESMAELAMGDWMIPTGKTAGEQVLDATDGQNGWDVAIASADSLVAAPFQNVEAFGEWKTKIATPAFQDYFADNITLDELETRLVEGGEDVLR